MNQITNIRASNATQGRDSLSAFWINSWSRDVAEYRDLAKREWRAEMRAYYTRRADHLAGLVAKLEVGA